MSQSGPRSCLGSPESIRGGPCPGLRIPESSRAVPIQCLRLKLAVPTGQPRQHTSCVNRPAAPTGRLRSGPASPTGLLPRPATGRLRAAQNGRLRQRALGATSLLLCSANRPLGQQAGCAEAQGRPRRKAGRAAGWLRQPAPTGRQRLPAVRLEYMAWADGAGSAPSPHHRASRAAHRGS